MLGEGLRSALVGAVPLALEQSAAEHASALATRTQVVREVLAHIAAHGARAPSDVGAAQTRIAQLAAESGALRQTLAAAHAELARLQAVASRVTEQLRIAEKHRDRAASDTLRTIEDPLGKAQRDAEAAQIAAAEAEKAQAEKRAENAQAPAVNAATEEELVTLRELAKARLDEIGEVRQELGGVKQELAATSFQLTSLPDERINAHPLYHELQAEMVFLQHEAERLRSAYAALDKENEELREFRLEFQHQTSTQANTHSDELQKQLKARDADIVRLRGQRDELNAEMLERRARDTVKFAQVDELKALLAPKDERIEALKGQAHRLQLQVAALRGDAHAVQVLSESEPGTDAVPALEAALKKAEEEKAALALHDVSDAHAELARLRALLDDGTPSEDVASADDVAARWASLQDSLQKARLEIQASGASTTTLYDEIDRLSSAYDQLEKQANAKLVNLAKLEDKILRLTTEKSKADNKYFAAMRAKDALDAEKRTLARSAERQAKVIERYTETEKGLGQQLTQAEKEITLLRRGLQAHTTKLAEVDRDRAVLRRKAAEAERAKSTAEQLVTQHLATITEESGAKVRAEERAAILDKEVSRLKRKVADANAGAPRKRGDDNTQLEYLDSLLKCSACKERYRDRIITRCLHTFCEQCVNARIQTRQRKCPHCGLAFATSDVQVLYCT